MNPIPLSISPLLRRDWGRLVSRNLLTKLYFFEPGRWYKGDGHSCHSFNLHNNTLVFLDTTNDTFRTFEVAIGHTNPLAWFGKKLMIILEELYTMVLDRSHTDKVIHLTVRNGKNFVAT